MVVNGERAAIPLIINNESVVRDTTFDLTNPATGELISHCAGATAEDANNAVAAAKAAFPVWSGMSPYDRRDIMLKAADVMSSRKEELIRYQMEDTGAARMFVEATFTMAVSLLKDFAGKISTIEGSVPTAAQNDAIIFKEPYGVVLGIAPWNAPYILGMRAVCIPLGAGNTIILKGSELSPRCFWAIGDVFREAGLPAGCVNVLYHRPKDASEVTTALIAHPAVRKISFTGSTNVGSIIGATAGKFLKPIVLELGGKAPAIVLDDANLEKAATECILGSFLHSGQICMATERIIVQRTIEDKFKKALAEAGEKLFGRDVPAPVLVTSAAVEKNKNLVADALSKGAGIVFGDHKSTESCKNGMRPIVVNNVTKKMDIYSTESFGPTVSLIAVDSDDEAIALANDSDYGLSASVFTGNLFRGLKVARQIESGAVHINSMTVHDEAALPHGGWNSSGFGRFAGPSGFDEFLQTRTVTWKQ